VQQYSFDINRELPGNIAVGFEYSGATIRNLGLGGANDATLNINQLDPSHLALGSALTAAGAQPVLRPPAGPGRRVNSPTITRAQLLRPFPQFGNILMRQNTGGKSQYHAAIFKFEKRMSNGWGGRINYTYSRLKDNFSSPRRTPTRGQRQRAERVRPGRRVRSQHPRRAAQAGAVAHVGSCRSARASAGRPAGVAAAILGDWTISSIIAFESGFPISVSNNSNNLERLLPDAAPEPRQRTRRPAAAARTASPRQNPGLWLTRPAFSDPGLYQLGTATPHARRRAHAAPQQLGLRGHQGHPPGRPRPRADPLRGAEHHQHGEDAGPNTSFGGAHVRPHHDQRGFMRLTQLMFRLSF
jgi:hypothetical protein